MTSWRNYFMKRVTSRMNDIMLSELITGTASGNKEQFDSLYRSQYNSVFAFSLSIVRDYHMANDIAHDTFLAVRNTGVEGLPYKNPSSWLLGIARNKALMMLRKTGREVELPEDNDICDDGIEEQVIYSSVLEVAMEVLSDRERQIVLMKAVSGYRHREIAKILNLPQGTVQSAYKHAMDKLRKKMPK